MENILTKSARSDSFESIPEADFLIQIVSDELDKLAAEELVSDYKKKEMIKELLPEPLLMEDKSRFVLFPIKNTDVSAVMLIC
jgi:hypothetical protein